MDVRICCVCKRNENQTNMKRCSNVDTCTACKKSHYSKILSIPDFDNDLKLGHQSKIFKHLWMEGLNQPKTCLKHRDCSDFELLCDVTYKPDGTRDSQVCAKCRTRKITLFVNPPETKTAKTNRTTLKNYTLFYQSWPSIVQLVSKICKNLPNEIFKSSETIQHLQRKAVLNSSSTKDSTTNSEEQSIKLTNARVNTLPKLEVMGNLNHLFIALKNSNELRPYLRVPNNNKTTCTMNSYFKNKNVPENTPQTVNDTEQIRVTHRDRNFTVSRNLSPHLSNLLSTYHHMHAVYPSSRCAVDKYGQVYP